MQLFTSLHQPIETALGDLRGGHIQCFQIARLIGSLNLLEHLIRHGRIVRDVEVPDAAHDIKLQEIQNRCYFVI